MHKFPESTVSIFEQVEWQLLTLATSLNRMLALVHVAPRYPLRHDHLKTYSLNLLNFGLFHSRCMLSTDSVIDPHLHGFVRYSPAIV